MYNFKEIENNIILLWDEKNIFKKSIDKRQKNKQYVFYDGPPFATGLPHYGHILALTGKDLFPRFWTMKGYRVERKWGWDCHGLPIENIAERELKIKDKKEIEEMGITKFNEFCRSKVLSFAEEWKKTVVRMGKWIEFDNSYKTMDNTYMESVWHIFHKLFDDGYIYEGKKILLFCPRCQTPLANAEVAMDNSYKEITEKTAIAKFKLADDDAYLLAWTTTPWTLIGNVAIAINPILTYVKIKSNGENLIIAKSRLQEIKSKYEIIKEFNGSEILNKEYEPLYHIPSDKKGHYIINGGNEVSSEEGTGMVHMALYGEFDYEMIKKYDLPIIQHIGPHGKIISGPKEWHGQWFKKADELVLDDLEKRNLLFELKDYTHSYPFCYRCETPLFYNAVNSWFVDIQKIKSRLIEKNAEINWYPQHIKNGRFKDILETAPDWSISRNRFWATSIPAWKCENEKCKNVAVIGSIKELQKKAIEKVPDNVDLHKHVVDNIHLKCGKCKNKMKRIPEVMDCWFESGSMPYAAKHYPFENKPWFKKNFPCDFVSEYVGQVRAWFYYMHVLSVLMFDKAPFKNVVVSGNILAADGSKMSKSKNNFPDPNAIFDKYGADSLRFYLMDSQLMRAQDLNFNEDGIKNIHKKVMMLLNNIKVFYEIYGTENSKLKKSSSKNILDKWIISKTNLMIRNATNALDDYDTITACNEIISFIDELSTWYIRRSRERFNSEKKSVRSKAIETLAYVLHNLSKVMAPITPFISEDIHQLLRKNCSKLQESVHLEKWPEFNPELINEELDSKMKLTRDLASKALVEREQSKIPIRQVLGRLEIIGAKLEKEYLKIIAEELNVKRINAGEGNELKLNLDTRITPKLEQEGYAREVVRRIQDLRKKLGLKKENNIKLFLKSDYDLGKHIEEIKKKTGAKNISFSEGGKETIKENIKDKEFFIGIDVVTT